jgi:hypothetical protein
VADRVSTQLHGPNPLAAHVAIDLTGGEQLGVVDCGPPGRMSRPLRLPVAVGGRHLIEAGVRGLALHFRASA